MIQQILPVSVLIGVRINARRAGRWSASCRSGLRPCPRLPDPVVRSSRLRGRPCGRRFSSLLSVIAR